MNPLGVVTKMDQCKVHVGVGRVSGWFIVGVCFLVFPCSQHSAQQQSSLHACKRQWASTQRMAGPC